MVMADPSYAKGKIRPNVHVVIWVEPATGNTVTHIEDYENNIALTNITDFASKRFWRLKGTIRPVEFPDMGNVALLEAHVP